MDYNKTINLPQTEFPMRAGLPNREPGMLERWEKSNIYNELLKKNAGKPERQYFIATCAECGGEAKLNFQPSNDRPVYCSACFEARRAK